MTWPKKERHRDREPGWRQMEESSRAPDDRVFRITAAQRKDVAKSLRYIDQARRALEAQQDPGNREIVRELQASADRVFDLLNDLEEIDQDHP